jgi:L,D-transpeptidase ErfK/SrfK
MRLSRRQFMATCLSLPIVGCFGRPAIAAQGPPGNDDLIGRIRFAFTNAGNTLLDVARGNDLGVLELMAANRGVDPWVPGSGIPLVLPTAFILPDAPRRGIVINLAELRIFYFAGRGKPVQTWPIGIGREYFTTPLGTTSVSIPRISKCCIARPA